jgi:alanine dehydrogenase
MDRSELGSQKGDRATKFISDAVAQQVLDWPAMIDAIRRTYSVPPTAVLSPPRSLARAPGPIWMRTLTGLDPVGPYMGVKQFGLAGNRTVRYMISLFDKQTGEIVALLDANSITALRTAATTAFAVDLMAPQGEATLGVLGSGGEASTHVRAIHAVRPLSKLTVFSPTEANRIAFAKAFEAETGVPSVAVATEEEAVRGHSIVVGATRSPTGKPAIEGRWLSSDTLLASIGATLPEQREIDIPSIQQAGIIIADVPEEVTEETGCFRDAHAAGVEFDHKVFTLNQLVLGELSEKMVGAPYKMYRSVGGPLQDIAVATVAYQRALEAGLASDSGVHFARKG